MSYLVLLVLTNGILYKAAVISSSTASQSDQVCMLQTVAKVSYHPGSNIPRKIPNRLVFNYKVNLLNDPSESPKHAENIRKSMQTYSDMEVEFLDDAGCYEAIKAVHSKDLADHFSNEKKGCFKSDICRLAQLADAGGYYFDNDLEAISDMRDVIPAETAFASAEAAKAPPAGSVLFQAILGVAPKHPIIMRTLNLTLEYYESFLAEAEESRRTRRKQKKKQKKVTWLGPEKMAEAFKWWSGQQELHAGSFANQEGPLKQSYILSEENAPDKYGLETRTGQEGCNYVVADSASKKALFWSRFVGASEDCP